MALLPLPWSQVPPCSPATVSFNRFRSTRSLFRTRSRPRSCAEDSPIFTHSAHSPEDESCRRIAPGQSSGWRAIKAQALPGTSSRWMAAYPRRFYARRTSLRRICFVLQVKPDRLDEYKARHRTVWPEMLSALRETGWSNYSLFLRPDGLLVGYLETEDFEHARAGMAAREVNERWQREMAGFFVLPEELLPDRAMDPLEEVFHL